MRCFGWQGGSLGTSPPALGGQGRQERPGSLMSHVRRQPPCGTRVFGDVGTARRGCCGRGRGDPLSRATARARREPAPTREAGGRPGRRRGSAACPGPRGQGPGVVVRLRWRATVESRSWLWDGTRTGCGPCAARSMRRTWRRCLPRCTVPSVRCCSWPVMGWAGARGTDLLGAAETAAWFLGALHERDFRGDEELADRLRTVTGDTAIPSCAPFRSVWRCSPCCWKATRLSPGPSRSVHL